MAHGVVRCVVRLPPSSLGSQWRRRRSFVSTLKQQRQRQSSSVCIVEVGPRDGLQNENSSSVVSVANKVELILRLMDAGCRTLEVASLVSPRMVPTMANSPEVLHELQEWRRRHTQTTTLQERQQQQDHPNDRNVKFSCLVPSLKYWPAALHAKVDEIAIFASASETFSQKNIHCSIAESMDRFRPLIEAALLNGTPVRGYLSCVVACPYEGKTSPTQLGARTEELLAMGCYQVSLGDTIGVGTPTTTRTMLDAALVATGNRPDLLAVHFHDTFGQALVNVWTALERDIWTVDASVAGLGGCPYAPGASGNLATEDLVYMLHGMGVETDIDLHKLAEAGAFICNVLGRKSNSKAGIALAAQRQCMDG